MSSSTSRNGSSFTRPSHCSLGGIVWAGETHWHYEKLLKKNEGARELLAQKTMYMNVATILQACCVWALPDWLKIHNQAKQKDHLHRLFILLGLYFPPPIVCRLRGAVYTMGHAGGGQVHDRHRNRLGVCISLTIFSSGTRGLMLNGKKNPLRHRTARIIQHGKEFSS